MLLRFAAVLSLSVLFACSPPPPVAPPVEGEVMGHVTVEGGDVAGVTLSLAGLVQAPLADGSFHFTQVPQGAQHLSATKAGYVTAAADVTVLAGATITQDLALVPLPPDAHSPEIVSFSVSPPLLARGETARVLVQAKDADGDALSYEFSVEAGWTVTPGGEPGSATLTAPEESGARATLVVTVSDGKGGSATGSVLVTTSANHAPVLVSLAGAATALHRGQRVALEASAFDPDGDALTYVWTAPEGWTIDGSGARVVLVAPDLAAAQGTVRLVVSDASGAKAEGSLLVSTGPNALPEVTITQGQSPCAPGGRIALAATATDADGDSLRFEWAIDSGWSLDGSGASVSAVAPAVHDGAASATLTVDDGHGGVVQKSVQLRTTANALPVLASLSALPPLVAAGGTIELRASASDADGEPLTYAWTLPEGWTLVGSGALVTVQAPAVHGARAVVELKVSDPFEGEANGSVSIATASNAPPVLTAVRAVPAEAAPGATVELAATAFDPNGDVLTYAWSAPSGWTFDGASNKATAKLVAPAAHGQLATVMVTVSDGTIDVSAPVVVSTTANHAPVIQNLLATGSPSAPGGAITLSASASDADADPLTYTWKAPAGWTISGSGAQVSLTAPNTKGATGTVLLTVSDGERDSTATVQVATLTNRAPIIASLSQTGSPVARGGTVSLTASASDADADPLTYTWEVPTGWTLSGSGAQVTLTAPNVAGRSDLVKLTVDDGSGGQASAQVSVATLANGAPVINSITANPPQVRHGGTVVVDVSAVDPDGDALSYTWTVPSGWTGSSTRSTISLVAPQLDGESAVVSVDVSDGTATRTARIAVATTAGRAPVIASVSAGTMPILPGAQASVSVSASDADGDTLSYAYSIGNGWSVVGSGASVQLRAPFANASSATLSVTVSDPYGGSASTTLPVSTSSCAAGTMNCDGNVVNGCEAALATDQNNCGVCANSCSGQTPACVNSTCSVGGVCSNGSSTNCNPTGSLLIPTSAFVDPNPPSGWTQCAGFINTAGDDIASNALDNCLNSTRLRIRVWNASNTLEEDNSATITSWSAWPNWNYLGSPSATFNTLTYWGQTTFFTTTDGRDACGQQSASNGTTFGSGNASVAIIATGNTNDLEYRVNCGGQALVERKIAIYR